MNMADNQARQSHLQQFRQETRAWLEENCPMSKRGELDRDKQYWGGRNGKFADEDSKVWFERMVSKGWTVRAVPDWPKEYGGAGLDWEEHAILKEEMRDLEASSPLFGHGIFMLGPALLEYANESQKKHFLNAIARGEIRWCQGYSEPNAGSDLASLQCRAEDKGDHFVVNGSKLWTSDGDKADWMFCLVRTSNVGKKQEGISFLLIDMASEGISVERIRMISGMSEFCQTFFDNVKVPKENLVSELNKGWTVAKRVLHFERDFMSRANDEVNQGDWSVQEYAKHYVGMAGGRLANSGIRRWLSDFEMKEQIFSAARQRAMEQNAKGIIDGALGSCFKYYGTELQKDRTELILAILGEQGLGCENKQGDDQFSDKELKHTRDWLNARALTIAGGSSEIQLNIIAKQVLGLPD